MSDVDIDMTEVIELARLLDLRDKDIAIQAAEAVRDAAVVTRDTAQKNAPVLTGELRDSIRITGSRLTRNVTARAPYAFYVEFGTSDTSPQPYLFPAGDRGEEQLLNRLAEIASEGL